MDTFLIIVILLTAFYMAWNIGANDVANAMGTSVGSGALTLRQAVILAAILEFAGAFFFGSHVSQTVQSGIINPEMFASNPRILVYGMLAALASSGIWLQIASYFGWPVSTTHSIIGALIGFGIAAGGVESVYWGSLGYIVSSWIFSPIVGGVIAYGLFMLIRKNIFYAPNPVEKAKKLTPYIVFFVIATLLIILLSKGIRSIEFSFYQTSMIIGTLSVFGWLISYWAVQRIPTPIKEEKKDLLPDDLSNSFFEEKNRTHAEYLVVEKIFGYLQIMSACMMAFAHGANDVANAIGPLSAAIAVLTTGIIGVEAPVPAWALALGGVGIVIGLATWGWRVIETIGKKITELTPTRGFAAEFGAALTIVIASRVGMPISTTHTLVGAVLGVGLARGLESVDLNTTRDIFISWIVTVPIGAFIAVVLFYPIQIIFN
jgi:phosphate/sulfate permease